MDKYLVRNVLAEGVAGQLGQCEIRLFRGEPEGSGSLVQVGKGEGVVVTECREGGRRMVSLDGLTYCSKGEMERFREHARQIGVGSYALLSHMVQEAECPDIPTGVGQDRAEAMASQAGHGPGDVARYAAKGKHRPVSGLMIETPNGIGRHRNDDQGQGMTP
jgi:hypothetical protein